MFLLRKLLLCCAAEIQWCGAAILNNLFCLKEFHKYLYFFEQSRTGFFRYWAKCQKYSWIQSGLAPQHWWKLDFSVASHSWSVNPSRCILQLLHCWCKYNTYDIYFLYGTISLQQQITTYVLVNTSVEDPDPIWICNQHFVDPNSYSEYGSGSILVKKGKLEAKITIQTFKDKTDKKYLPV